MFSFSHKQNVAIAIAFIFHFFGVIGIVYTKYSGWFVANTTFNLVLMAVLVFYTHFLLKNNTRKQNVVSFLWFVVITFFVGFLVEVIGVNTQLLFGSYEYSTVLGVQLFNVPVLIGLQWLVTMYCCGCIMQFVNNWAMKKLELMGETTANKKTAQSISLLVDAALLATFFDYILEPAAKKLNYWQWQNNTVPLYNYTCWFFISMFLMYIFNKLQFNKLNTFAIHLFIIQSLFFIAIRLYL